MKITRSLSMAFFLFVFLTGSLALPGKPAYAQDIPKQAYVSGVVGRRQTYALSCESRSAADLAAFYGVSINEVDFFNNLPKSDNPNKGFVGNVHGTWGYVPPNAYGVHAKPVARLLREYGLDAKAYYGMSWKELRTAVAAGKPVIVWVIGNVWSGKAQYYTANDGQEVLVAAYEHTMIMIGYDENSVQLIDAGTGYSMTHPVSNFRDSWGVLGNMAVAVEAPPQKAPDPVSQPENQPQGGQQVYTVQSGDYLKKVADKYGVAWQDIAALNGLYYPYIIYAGQKLKIPGGQAASQPPAPEPTKKPAPKPTEPPPSNPPDKAVTPTLTPPAAPQEKPAASAKTYTVQRGDYLMKIARELNLDWRIIAELNGLSAPFVVYPGQVLKLPKGAAQTQLEQPAPTAAPPPEVPASSEVPDTYVVQRGDYLVAIARKFNLSWQTLAALNGIQYPYVVYPGQVLKLK